MRSFFRWLARHHGVANAQVRLLATPKARRPLPRALSVEHARAAAEDIGEVSDAAAQQARDVALFTLLYGCGLRIAEALALNVADVPGAEAPLRVVGKGAKERLVPVLPAAREAMAAWLRLHPRPTPEAPLFLGARGGRLDPRWRSARCAVPPPRRPAGARDAARAAAFVRDASAGRRRRSARDPGAARPRQPVDHPTLHVRGHRAAGRSLAGDAPARLSGRAIYSAAAG